MSKASLPSSPDLGWLKKRAKQVLVELRRSRPKAQLSEAQLVVARDYGLSSWRALVREVEERRAGPAEPPDIQESIVAEFLRRVGNGDRERVEAMLGERPDLIHAVGPHPFWRGRPQALHGSDSTHWRTGCCGRISSTSSTAVFGYPPGAAARAKPTALAAECDELLGLARLALDPEKSVLESAALQIRFELVFDVDTLS